MSATTVRIEVQGFNLPAVVLLTPAKGGRAVRALTDRSGKAPPLALDQGGLYTCQVTRSGLRPGKAKKVFVPDGFEVRLVVGSWE